MIRQRVFEFLFLWKILLCEDSFRRKMRMLFDRSWGWSWTTLDAGLSRRRTRLSWRGSNFWFKIWWWLFFNVVEICQVNKWQSRVLSKSAFLKKFQLSTLNTDGVWAVGISYAHPTLSIVSSLVTLSSKVQTHLTIWISDMISNFFSFPYLLT